MKKIFVLIMIAFIMTTSTLFAYEPKKECFKVYTYIDKASYKETVVVEADVLYYDWHLDNNRCLKRYLNVDLKDLKYEAEKNYFNLLGSRNDVEHYKKEKEMEKRYKKDHLVKIDEAYIEKKINEAVYEIPFVTRENFHKISRRKYMKTFIRYMESLKK